MAIKYLDYTGLSYFWSKVKQYIDTHSGGASVLDYYPVGSYYETSDTTFNPNTAWGGTWSLETAGQVHVSAGTGYTVGDVGGSKDAIVPYHTHGNTIKATTPSLSHDITQPAFKLPQTAANVQNEGNYVSVNQALSWGTGGLASGTTYKYLRTSASGGAVSRSTPTVPATVCTRTTNVGVDAHNATDCTMSGSVSPTGDSVTDANMMPYIVVNRWHRTA